MWEQQSSSILDVLSEGHFSSLISVCKIRSWNRLEVTLMLNSSETGRSRDTSSKFLNKPGNNYEMFLRKLLVIQEMI